MASLWRVCYSFLFSVFFMTCLFELPGVVVTGLDAGGCMLLVILVFFFRGLQRRNNIVTSFCRFLLYSLHNESVCVGSRSCY